MEASTQKRRWMIPNQNFGARSKTPFKILSPITVTKTIHLHDWWLMRPQEGEGIAVGGFTIKREGVETMFCSASIKERRDSSTLESSDGFTILISGLINRSVTRQNGFPSEVCSNFLSGFPCNWDDFTSQQEGSTCARSFDGTHAFPPSVFQDMSYLLKRDLLLLANGLYEEDAISEHIFNDLLTKLKPAEASSVVDITRDCDLPITAKSKEVQENGTHNFPRLNLCGVRTRRMVKMANTANSPPEDDTTPAKAKPWKTYVRKKQQHD